jgi:hypothetical protein
MAARPFAAGSAYDFSGSGSRRFYGAASAETVRARFIPKACHAWQPSDAAMLVSFRCTVFQPSYARTRLAPAFLEGCVFRS